MAIKDKAHRAKPHRFENTPPQQDKYARGDDDWNLRTTACPVDSPKVSSAAGDSRVVANEHSKAFPRTDSEDSRFIHSSTTNGKR